MEKAITLCSPLVREYLINYARPLIYSTSLSFPSLAAIRAVYSLLEGGKTKPVRLVLFSFLRTPPPPWLITSSITTVTINSSYKHLQPPPPPRYTSTKPANHSPCTRPNNANIITVNATAKESCGVVTGEGFFG